MAIIIVLFLIEVFFPYVQVYCVDSVGMRVLDSVLFSTTVSLATMHQDSSFWHSVSYRIAGIFRGGGGNFRENQNLAYFVENFSWSRSINHTPIHPGRAHCNYERRFVGKYFVVRFSTTKTTKILPLENYPLYGICSLFNLRS